MAKETIVVIFILYRFYAMSKDPGRGNFPEGDFPVKLIYKCIWLGFYRRGAMICSYSLLESLLLESNPLSLRFLETSLVTN